MDLFQIFWFFRREQRRSFPTRSGFMAAPSVGVFLTFAPLRSLRSPAVILGFNFMVLSLLFFWRFFAQRVWGFLFAGRGRDELHAAHGSFAFAFADVVKSRGCRAGFFLTNRRKARRNRGVRARRDMGQSSCANAPRS